MPRKRKSRLTLGKKKDWKRTDKKLSNPYRQTGQRTYKYNVFDADCDDNGDFILIGRFAMHIYTVCALFMCVNIFIYESVLVPLWKDFFLVFPTLFFDLWNWNFILWTSKIILWIFNFNLWISIPTLIFEFPTLFFEFQTLFFEYQRYGSL